MNHWQESSKSFRCITWLLICAIMLPASMIGCSTSSKQGASPSGSESAHVVQRLNSRERASALAAAAQVDAAAHDEFTRNEVVAKQPASTSPANVCATTVAQNDVKPQETPGPQSVTEVLFNYAASFAGVPGLASSPESGNGVDAARNEGLGFHQDGTARKAGGVTGASGPSAKGQRANAYMQSGLNSGLQNDSVYAGLHPDANDMLSRNDPTRGGRIGAQSGYSRELGNFDLMSMALDRGFAWGNGLVNSMGEAAISGIVDGGRARLNFQLDKDGYFSGEGDALLPLYDSAHTTVYTQLGARSMHDSSDTRWIGNFGVGQRWFPSAEGESPQSGDYTAGNLMLGYNAFFDYDFTRSHQRGGVGVEAQYDWLHLASNYYFPLSSWKGSEDFGKDLKEERAAKGWDARVKAHLPFYRNVAVIGAYSQWYGDQVGMFGAGRLEKDPKVWSYGVEYTPVPLVSGFVTQKSTERGRTDTEFGMNFTYHFNMPWEEQINHSKVAELRTVSGSRHEFVDRENKIILEYKDKAKQEQEPKEREKLASIEFVRSIPYSSTRAKLEFRVKDAFGKYSAGTIVSVKNISGTAQPDSFVTDAGGLLVIDPFTNWTDDAGYFSLSVEGLASDYYILLLGGGTYYWVEPSYRLPSGFHNATVTSVAPGFWGNIARPQAVITGEILEVTFLGGSGALEINTSNGFIFFDDIGAH